MRIQQLAELQERISSESSRWAGEFDPETCFSDYTQT